MSTQKSDVGFGKNWLSYREEIRILDCTIRDGGLMNNHKFDDKVVRAVFDSCRDAGIDYMEIGYRNSDKIFSRDKFGAWKFCSEDDIKGVIGDNKGSLKISVMIDVERTDYANDILPRNKSVIDMVRVASYIHQIPTALEMLNDAHDKGYETCFNLMSVSTVPEYELDAALEMLSKSVAGSIYLVDSFGSLYSEHVHYLMDKYLKFAKPAGKEVGIHAHNNQQLAYANTIEAIVKGANMLDATMAGLGRGAGNCPIELLVGFLHNPKYHLRPLLKCIQEHIEPMRKEIIWGYDIPYMMTGLLNQHPRAAIEFNEGNERHNYLKFYDSIIQEE